MRKFAILVTSLIFAGLTIPVTAYGDARDVPGSADWYFFLDLEQMKSSAAGKSLYALLQEDVFAEVKKDIGVDLARELDRITAYSVNGGGTLIFEGDLSQATRDKVMTFVASGGDIKPLKASGKTYFHFGGDDDAKDDVSYDAGNIKFNIESLGDESWVSMGLKRKVVVTSSEADMKTLLANKGRLPDSRKHRGALLVLSAEKTLLQAGLDANAVGHDTDGDWSSNILRNTEKAALLIAAKADKLSIEAELLTTQAEMAESLASVARGLISLVAFDDDMEPETAAMLRRTKVEAKGKSLTLSLTVDPELLVATIRD
jgi:hypothetical protein